MNVSLTPELEAFVSSKVETGRYRSASEVVREALRHFEEHERWKFYERAVLEGLASGPGREVTPEFWEERRRHLDEQLASEDAK